MAAAERPVNRLAQSIAELCEERTWEEKWLLAPSLRVGFQWLDAVTRWVGPVLNARVKTFAVMALELAAPEMERRALAFMRGLRSEVLVADLLARLGEGGGYLSRLGTGPGMVRAVGATLRDLRLAGLLATDLAPRLFEVPDKGREMISLLAAYEEGLASRNLVDYAGVLRLAAARLQGDASALPAGLLVAMPEDMAGELHGLERSLWEAIPEGRRVTLETDLPHSSAAGRASDASLLAWVSRPEEAPFPRHDGTAEIFRAVGEVNEVREVLRRCVEGGIPFDEVEILHTDAATYVPLVYELCSSLADEPGGPVPVTFSEGIPVRYSRPGRALTAWLSWLGEDFPQSTLVRMIQDGLLEIDPKAQAAWGFTRPGAVLRALPIGKGRERYLAAIDAELASLAWRSSREEPAEEGTLEREGYGAQKADILRSLRGLVRDLLAYAPGPGGSERELLEGAASFLLRRARGVNEFDAYARKRLLDEIEELAACLPPGDPAFPDLAGWLSRLAGHSTVEGKGPRPACLYVAPLAQGGHSGRMHTFILGMDDGRFPGAVLQDPLLLDTERSAISEDLSTAADRAAASLEGFARVAARTRGTVTLSYCCHSLADDREMFPSPAVLAAYRILSGNREGVLDDLLAWLPEPVSFAPRDPGRCIDPMQWWLCRLCGETPVEDAEAVVSRAFPHLGRGLEARRARESDLFTPYDGNVPEAGEDLDPTRPDGPVLSARRLEMLGRCPLEYFLAYVLDIKPPEEYQADTSRWLDPRERGDLLHAVFHRFLFRLREEGRPPSLQRDWDALEEILDAEISAWSRAKPPPNREVLQGEVEDLRRSARIFLQEEEICCRDRRPLYFEVAVGMETRGEGGPIDSPTPIEITLPGGKTIRVRGYIDRVDEVGGSGSNRFAVCDYKTGSSWGYKEADPFRQGRRVQNFIYLEQAASCLAGRHPGAEVTSFEYFFPGTKAHGERCGWDAGTLQEGRQVLGELCEMLSRGCFPFTDNADDVDEAVCDYRAAFGEVEKAVQAMQAKLSNPANAPLAPFRRLRGYAQEDQGGHSG